LAHLNPAEAFDHFQKRVLEGIESHFPGGRIQGKVQSLYLDNLEVKDELHPDDLRGQHKAKVGGESWSVPVFAHLTLKDNETGKVIDSKRIRIAEIPKTTSRYSYIVAGPSGSQEYQVDNQWQLKPGVYTKRRRNGELESRMNVAGRASFDVVFHPDKKVFEMQYGASKSHLPLYPLLKTMGVSDDDLTKSWGKEIFDANKNIRAAGTAVERFYKVSRKTTAPSKEEAEKHLVDTMLSSRLRPDSTSITLGKPYDHVSGEVLHKATEKLLKVHGGHPEDDRDSLIFKDLRTVGDFAYDFLRNAGKVIGSRAQRQVNKATSVRDVVKFDLFNEPIKHTFHKNMAARVASQINPVEMVSSSMQTTIMGPGGIQSEQSVNNEAKFVNPSHLGFLDPINTPEGEKTGVTLRLPIGVKKVGNEPRIHLYNTLTGKTDLVSPGEFMSARVVLPDQVRWEGGKPVPLHDTVKMSGQDNKIVDGKFSDAHYVMRHSSQLFNMTSNLIPFLGNTSGNRASMASRHIEQSISLLHREAPLVQVHSGVATKGIESFEGLLGKQASHATLVGGKVLEIRKDGIIIQDEKGAHHEVQIYNNYPVNDTKSVLHSTPLVKVGDTVKAGQTIADTNYSRNGTLALGTNLRVGYIPFKGYNFEDGIVISQSAAAKLSSEHLHKDHLQLDRDITVNKRKFQIQHPGLFSRVQLEKVGDGGIVQVGQKVSPGDPLVLATKPYQLKDRSGLSAIRRSMSGSHTDKSMRWDSDFQGEVVDVHHGNDKITVHVRTIEPMQVGDKMAGRYGNKGIVTKILEDKEMPHTTDGKHIEVALNPSGVPGRMNVGQVLETAIAKIAKKTGNPYLVKNFEPETDHLQRVKDLLKEHGIPDTEEVIDPHTKQSLGKAMVGPQYMMKLVHQVDKKLSVRSGMAMPGMRNNEHYDLNLQPSSGGGTGGQSMGVLGMYAMLAHGAKANIREMQTWKSEGPDPQTNPDKRWASQHNQVWAAIQTGAPLPTPTPTFAFRKFEDMLRASGVNMEKKGHNFILSPMTDGQVKAMAPNVLTKPMDLLYAKNTKDGDLRPRPGGLFDEKLTGGHQGRKWSRIELAEPLPNPVFESAIQSLTGLKKKDYASILHGEKAVTSKGALVNVGEGTTGGAAIKMLLDKIDVAKELPTARNTLKTVKGPKVDAALKRVKFLQALDQLKLKPSEAYVLHNLPVLPPVMRPVSQLPSGDLKYADVNGLYSEFAKINEKLKDPILTRHLTDESKKDLRREYYDGVKGLMGVGIPYDDVTQKGLLHQIAGGIPKNGFFQETLMNRRQDLTMRSTIIPEPALGLDEVGIPRAAALDLFKPFVVKKLWEMGAVKTPMGGEAAALLDKKPKAVWDALEKVMAERPVLMKRDPALHKYSVQAFKARLSPGSAVQIHPLVTGGYNADFDGDTMSIFVPISHEAVEEARKMFPSNNLLAESTGKVVYQPTLESALGLYKLSRVNHGGAVHKFDNPGLAIDHLRNGKMHVNDRIHIPGGETTAGRILLAATLPEDKKGGTQIQKNILHDLKTPIDRKGLDTLLTGLAKEHTADYGTVVNRLKDMGNGAAFGTVVLPHLPQGHAFKFDSIKGYPGASLDPKLSISVPVGTHTLGLDDFTPDTAVRNHVLGATQKKVDAIYADKKLPLHEQDRQSILLWNIADGEMKKQHIAKEQKNPSNLFLMHEAGVKPGWEQYKQMVLAPMLFQDSASKTLPTPVTKSYSEGLDVAGYWNQMPGARRGAVMKVQEVQEPGYMSKLLMNNMMHLLVNSHDCGTTHGIALGMDERDIHDRHLAQDFKQGDLHFKAGDLVTTDMMSKIRRANQNAKIIVRSPLKCEEEKGLCQKCVGLSATGTHHPLGTNIGVISAHTVGERAVQLTLKSFHTGGVVEAGGAKNLLNSFARFQQLAKLEDTVADAATLAMQGGKIDKIDNHGTGTDVWIGGEKHFVGKDTKGNSLAKDLVHASLDPAYVPWKPPVVGMHVEPGQHLSDPNRTILNPHDLYRATKSIDQVQNHLASEIYKLYKDEHIKRRAVEVMVKSMSNLTKVHDPGDHPSVLRGEFRPTSVVRKMNAELVQQGKRPIEHEPVLKGVEYMPLELQEDWMAKMQHRELRDTLLDASANLGVSTIHGLHPVPGIAYGAEFGLTSADSKKPGLHHLNDVQKHHY